MAEPLVEGERKRPGFRDRYLRRNRTARLVWRSTVGVVGALIIAAGAALLPLPGPGWLIIFVGLAVLASEFAWAQRLLQYARDKVGAWSRWVRRQPLPVRFGLGVGCVGLVLLALGAYFSWQGVPGWLPLSSTIEGIVPGD